MKTSLFFLSFFVSAFLSYSQDFSDSLKQFFDFVQETRDYREGFSRSSGANDFNYHSMRAGINECLITRASSGQMAIEWITAQVEDKYTGDGVGFLWIAAMDIISSRYIFDVYLNDIKRFSIPSSDAFNWSLENAEGGSLKFFTIEKDQHGDAHGYMALWAPKSWLKAGQSQKIKIVGEAAGSSTWIIVYKANDAASFLHQSVVQEKWLSLEARKNGNGYEVSILTPGYFSGESLAFSYGSRKGTVITEKHGSNAVGNLNLPLKILGKPFTIEDSIGEIVSIEAFGQPGSTTKLLSKTILTIDQHLDENQTIYIEANRVYAPGTVQSLKNLSRSDLKDGKIYLMNSSHQDIAWMDSPEKCELERDTMLLTPLLDLASRDPDYRFDVEDALMLKEYIHRHPDKRPLIQQMLSDGRISCGSTFIQPYEEMYSGEALARQFYLGAKWLKDEFNYQSRVYWNVDVPGRTLQMPQIMKKAGTNYLMMSRFERGIYQWYSPDGSSITAFSPGHYADAFTPLQKNFNDAAQYIGSSSLFWEKYYPEKSSHAVIPLLSDWDMSPAVNYSQVIGKWKSIGKIQNEKGDFIPVSLPQFNITLGDEFFPALENSVREIPSIHGERPAIWLYIHGPSHQEALKASREGDMLLTQAEKFATALAWVNGSFKNYPQEELNRAWEAKIYPDHGWGGKNGEITDRLFLEKFQFAKTEAERIRDKALQEISARIKTIAEKGSPLVVFNSLNWIRTDVVRARLNFDEGIARGIRLNDSDGKEIPVQIIESELFGDGSLKSARICFVAEEVPSIGYKTFYYSADPELPSAAQRNQEAIESRYYKLILTDGGIESIYDKQLEKELIDPAKFKAGEIFTMRSVGNGAGEFADVQQPDMVEFDKTGNYSSQWKLEQNGPVYASYRMRQPIRNAVVEQEVVVYHDLKRIDFFTEILNWEGILFREYRFALPLNMKNGQVVYEVPYGVLEVGKDEMEGNAGERYIYPCRETRPRGIQNWIGAYDQDFSVILSSSVAVSDYIDPTDDPVANLVLQPILFASRQSCHGEGNDYLQTGDHSFHFSLTSTTPDWKNGYHAGLQANEPLMAVVSPEPSQSSYLPEEDSFFSLDASNVVVSTIKKAEDDQQTVIRLVEMEGKDTEVSWDTFKPIDQIFKVNLIEEPLNEKASLREVEIKIGHHAIETFKLK
jgi:alpha-mannosidase